MYCENCGAEIINSNAKFCYRCGVRLIDVGDKASNLNNISDNDSSLPNHSAVVESYLSSKKDGSFFGDISGWLLVFLILYCLGGLVAISVTWGIPTGRFIALEYALHISREELVVYSKVVFILSSIAVLFRSYIVWSIIFRPGRSNVSNLIAIAFFSGPVLSAFTALYQKGVIGPHLDMIDYYIMVAWFLVVFIEWGACSLYMHKSIQLKCRISKACKRVSATRW